MELLRRERLKMVEAYADRERPSRYRGPRGKYYIVWEEDKYRVVTGVAYKRGYGPYKTRSAAYRKISQLKLENQK